MDPGPVLQNLTQVERNPRVMPIMSVRTHASIDHTHAHNAVASSTMQARPQYDVAYA